MKRFDERLTPDRAAKMARFAAFAVMFAFGIGALGFGVLGFVANSRATGEEARSKALQNEVARIRGVLTEAESRDAVGIDDQSRAVAALQRSVAQLSRAYDCQLVDFLASTDAQPYLTRFEKHGASNGWSQIEAQFTVQGKTRFVLELLIQLANQSTPIELNSVQLNREDVSDSGSSIRAKVQLRILVQGGGPSA